MADSRSPRDDLDLMQRTARVDTAAITDANKSLRVLPASIVPLSSNPHLLGPAVTADARDDLVSVLAGLEACVPGDVLVITSNGSNAVAGELFAGEARRRGLAGIVIDGYCRDTGRLKNMALPIYARGATPRAATATSDARVNVPIMIGDVTVCPGDILLGDQDGIVVATKDELTAVIEHAESIQFTEEALLSSMDEGTMLFDKLNFTEHLQKIRTGQPSTLQFLA